MGEIIRITIANAEELRKAQLSLMQNFKYLINCTKEYPLQIDFAGYRFTCEGEADIKALIRRLNEELDQWDAGLVR